jgi:hypothetical protein
MDRRHSEELFNRFSRRDRIRVLAATTIDDGDPSW